MGPVGFESMRYMGTVNLINYNLDEIKFGPFLIW